jgi:alkylation response protein AidB-like acyl-CoA dehydrogenase
MNHESAVIKALEIASGVLAPSAAQNDTAGRFSDEAIQSLSDAGLLGLMLPGDVGGAGLGPRTFAGVTAALAEADASVALVYLMHILGTAAVAAARPSAAPADRDRRTVSSN